MRGWVSVSGIMRESIAAWLTGGVEHPDSALGTTVQIQSASRGKYWVSVDRCDPTDDDAREFLALVRLDPKGMENAAQRSGNVRWP